MPDPLFCVPDVAARPPAGRPYWLVFGLPWPGEHLAVAPAAYAASAPACGYVSPTLAPVLAVGHAYADRHPKQPVVWFSDLTRWLDTLGLDWPTLGVDWSSALDTLPHSGMPGVLLGIDRRTHLILCDATRHGVTLVQSDGRHEPVTEQERTRLHGHMRELLDRLPAAATQPGPGAPQQGVQ
jgi:hypothetical protein